VSDLRRLLGLAAILAVAFLGSNNRGRIRWRTVVVGLAIQVAFAALVLRGTGGVTGTRSHLNSYVMSN
jgi:concentrative nucleoside transporter, CNT family